MTADLNDVNMIDPYHLENYGVTTVNYNRDVEIFPVLSAMFKKISGECPYKSPTDMGVNMAGNCIFDDAAVREAANDEIIRRYYNALCNVRKGNSDGSEVQKIELLMNTAGISPDDRPVVAAANQKAAETEAPAAAIELPDGRIITGKTSNLLGATSALLLNALKELGEIDDSVDLISHEVLKPVQSLKVDVLGNHNPRLHTDELLVALSICSVSDATAKLAMEQVGKLKNCNVHSSVILSQVDLNVLKKLGLHVTCEPVYQTKKLFHR